VVPQSQAVRHVSLAALDGKAALTVDFFPRSSVIAFACADGQVRLWDCARWARTLTLTSTSSKPIVAIFARLVHPLSLCRTRTPHTHHRTRAPHTLASKLTRVIGGGACSQGCE
jgi:WD40 repeat protein